MKLTTIKSIGIIILGFLIIGGACNDSFLQEKPKHLLSPESFFQSEGDFRSAVTGIYSCLYGGWSGFDCEFPLILTAGGEDVYSPWPIFSDIDQCNASPASTVIASMWKSFYKAISNANNVIGNIETGRANGVPQKALDEAEGEACFMRAFSYFWLVRLWGEVQLTTLDNQHRIIEVPQSSVADIYASIVENLETAEAKLPPTFPERGRANQAVAKALLAKVYLTMAGWPLNKTENYALAKAKAKEVIDMDIYDLEENFADLWFVKNKLTNKEIMFAFYGSADGAQSNMHVYSRYFCGDENGTGDWWSERRLIDGMPDGPRKDATFTTVYADGSTWLNSLCLEPYGGAAPQAAKYRDAGKIWPFEANTGSFNGGEGFAVILRYADVLLMYAEAANMVDGVPSADALEAINKVRRRAMGLNYNTPDATVDIASGISQADFDRAVIDERNWELAFEFNRWFDLVRKEIMVEVNKPRWPNVSEKNMLLPKPQAEIEMTRGNLIQNPGY